MKVKVLAVMALLSLGFMAGCELVVTENPPDPNVIVMDFGGTGAGVFCFSNTTKQYTVKTAIMDTVFGEWNDKGFTNVDIAPGKAAMIINMDAGTYYFFLQLHNNSYNFDFAMSNNINTTIVISNTNYASIDPSWLAITNHSNYSITNFYFLDASTFDFCSILVANPGDSRPKTIDAGSLHTAAPYYSNWCEIFPAEIPAGTYNLFLTNKTRPTNMTVLGESLAPNVTNYHTAISTPFTLGVWSWN
jgi:hypothetical protein